MRYNLYPPAEANDLFVEQPKWQIICSNPALTGILYKLLVLIYKHAKLGKKFWGKVSVSGMDLL